MEATQHTLTTVSNCIHRQSRSHYLLCLTKSPSIFLVDEHACLAGMFEVFLPNSSTMLTHNPPSQEAKDGIVVNPVLERLLISTSSQKCDGNQPICNQCLRFNRANECEFKEGPAPSTTRVLEQHIARLESRIAELETDDPNAVRLHDPYSQSRPAASSTHPSPAIQPAQINWWDMPEPPTAMQQLLYAL